MIQYKGKFQGLKVKKGGKRKEQEKESLNKCHL